MPHADRHARVGVARRRTLVRAGALLGCALLMAGCASMPDSSDVTRVGEEPRTDSDPQVRVFGVQPQKNEQPMQIVRGFLEATTSDEADYRTAKNYLTGAAEKWDPFTRIIVLSGAPQFAQLHNGADRLDTGVSITLAAGQSAVVDRKHSYAPASGTYSSSFHLSQVKGEWRIDSLPDGLVLDESDFERIYRSVNMYYFARLGPEDGDTPLAGDVLVADPVYVRRRIDPLTSSVQALLAGPSTWLQPVVDSAFPAGTQLKGAKLALDDSGRLRVPLGGIAARPGRSQCDRMAAQLLETVQDQSSVQVTSVEVERADGTSVCTLGHQQAQAYAPERVAGSGSEQYFVDADHRMEGVSSDGDNPQPQRVPGPFGDAQAGLKWVAVSRDEQTAAGVRTDGRSLYVAPLSGTEGPSKKIMTSKAGFTAPSWDGLGNLWVADTNPAGPGLLMWRNGTTTDVLVPDLNGGRIQAVRVAADGVRVALLVKRDGRTVLQLGRVERTGTADHPQVAVTELRTVAPGLVDVEAASWAGDSRLVVVGKQWRGVQQLQYVDTDGSAAYTPPLPGISTVTGVAAFEDQTRPLLVSSDEGMFRLPADADWREVSSNGTAPVYPG